MTCLSMIWPAILLQNFKNYANSHKIQDDTYLALLASTGSLLSAVSRIPWGYTIDKLSFKYSILINFASQIATALLLK